jgi:hypothetical protein
MYRGVAAAVDDLLGRVQRIGSMRLSLSSTASRHSLEKQQEQLQHSGQGRSARRFHNIDDLLDDEDVESREDGGLAKIFSNAEVSGSRVFDLGQMSAHSRDSHITALSDISSQQLISQLSTTTLSLSRQEQRPPPGGTPTLVARPVDALNAPRGAMAMQNNNFRVENQRSLASIRSGIRPEALRKPWVGKKDYRAVRSDRLPLNTSFRVQMQRSPPSSPFHPSTPSLPSILDAVMSTVV